MNDLREEHRLAVLLEVAQLPRSTYYYQMKVASGEDRHAPLKAQIQQVYDEHKGRYGYRRVMYALRNAGHWVNHKLVYRLMDAMGLKAVVRRKKYRSYRGPVGHVAPNLLQRQFEAAAPNQKWVTDVTEFKVNGQKLYLSPILDLYNGEIVTYEMNTRPVMPLVTQMLTKALKQLKSTEKPLLHSDQGWQYQQARYGRLLDQHGLTQSMSRKGNCLDNATMESFFGTLKSELFRLEHFETIEQLIEAIHEYIDYYNHRRIKLKLKGLSPVQYRIQAFGT